LPGGRDNAIRLYDYIRVLTEHAYFANPDSKTLDAIIYKCNVLDKIFSNQIWLSTTLKRTYLKITIGLGWVFGKFGNNIIKKSNVSSGQGSDPLPGTKSNALSLRLGYAFYNFKYYITIRDAVIPKRHRFHDDNLISMSFAYSLLSDSKSKY